MLTCNTNSHRITIIIALLLHGPCVQEPLPSLSYNSKKHLLYNTAIYYYLRMVFYSTYGLVEYYNTSVAISRHVQWGCVQQYSLYGDIQLTAVTINEH